MASIKSTILVVTGSFCNPKFYDSTVNILPKDVQIEIPHLPTVGLGKDTGRPGPVPTMNDDAEFLLGRIKRLVVDEDKDVVVVAHSYGGVPSTEAIGMAKEQGLLKEDRKAKGEKGGVVRLAYMTVLVPELGGNAADMLGEIEEQYRMDFGVDVRTKSLPDSQCSLMHHAPTNTQPGVRLDVPQKSQTNRPNLCAKPIRSRPSILVRRSISPPLSRQLRQRAYSRRVETSATFIPSC